MRDVNVETGRRETRVSDVNQDHQVSEQKRREKETWYYLVVTNKIIQDVIKGTIGSHELRRIAKDDLQEAKL